MNTRGGAKGQVMTEAAEQKSPLSYWPADRSEPVLDRTVGDALRAAALEFGPKIALIEGCEAEKYRRRWTFAELLSASEEVARALLTRFEVGEHIAIWSPNCPEWILLEFGAALSGLTLVTVNPAFQAKELAYVLQQSKAVGLIVAPVYRNRDLLAVVDEARPSLPLLRGVLSLDDWPAFIASASDSQNLPLVTPGDIAQIQYTSGTTGFPKGALLPHRGLANNGRFFARAISAGPGDVWINPMPLFHTAGCGLVTLGALQTGGTQVLPPGFDPALMLRLIESERGTITLSVPTMLIAMLEHSDRTARDLSSWRMTALGGAPVPVDLIRRSEHLLNVQVTIGFGQTEASPYITHTLPNDPNDRWHETVGRALPQTEVKIADPITGETVPRNVLGEICTRGYAVMAGYFDNSAATSAALDAEGWLHTGDLGTMDDDGYCRVQGRLKDMIIRGGENIYPREIEDLLFTHPLVGDAAVIGVPDDTWGEIVVAFIRPAAAGQPSEESLIAHCRQHLATFKTPRHWRFIDQFPQTASGKIQKFALRDLFLHETR
jgi:fatty-acyl-CoA synthase